MSLYDCCFYLRPSRTPRLFHPLPCPRAGAAGPFDTAPCTPLFAVGSRSHTPATSWLPAANQKRPRRAAPSHTGPARVVMVTGREWVRPENSERLHNAWQKKRDKMYVKSKDYKQAHRRKPIYTRDTQSANYACLYGPLLGGCK